MVPRIVVTAAGGMGEKQHGGVSGRANLVVTAQATILIIALVSSALCWNVVVIKIADLSLAFGSRSNSTQIKEDTEYFESAGLRVFYNIHEQGLLYAAPLIGGVLVAPLAKFLLRKYHAREVYSGMALLSVVCTALMPAAIGPGRVQLALTVALRTVQGVGFALIFPTVAAVMNYWTTLAENGVFMSMFMGVAQFAAFFSIPISSYCIRNYGWPLVFYMHAAWSGVMWALCTFNHSENSVFQRANIFRGNKTSFKGAMNRLTNPAILAILLASMANSAVVLFIVEFLQLYLMSVHGIRMLNSGMVVGALICAQFVVKIVSGFLVQRLEFMPLTWRVRLFNTVAFFGSAGLLFWEATGVKSDEARLFTVLFVFILIGFNAGGFVKSPVFTQQGVWLIGAVHMVNAITCILFGFVVPILSPNSTADEFNLVFIVLAGGLVATNVLFCAFCKEFKANSSSMLTISTISPESF